MLEEIKSKLKSLFSSLSGILALAVGLMYILFRVEQSKKEEAQSGLKLAETDSKSKLADQSKAQLEAEIAKEEQKAKQGGAKVDPKATTSEVEDQYKKRGY